MKILLIAPFPPPITGQSLAAKVFFDEAIKYHQVEVANLSKDSFKQGVNSIDRIIQVFRILNKVWVAEGSGCYLFYNFWNPFLET